MISVFSASAMKGGSDSSASPVIASNRRVFRSRTASTISSSTPTALAAIHTQATTSLLVTTAVTRAARPMTASTSATISIERPPAALCGGRWIPSAHIPHQRVSDERNTSGTPTGTARTRRRRSPPVPLNCAGPAPRAGIPGRSSGGCGTRAQRCAAARGAPPGPSAAD